MVKASGPKKTSLQGHTEDFLTSWERARPDLDLRDFLQGIALMRLGKILNLSFERMCQKTHDISAADMRVLLALRRMGPPYERRPTDLYKAILVGSGTMTRQVDRLTERGLTARKPDARHAGGFLIELTPTGKEVADYATNYLATKSLLLKGGAGMSQELKAAGEEYVRTMLRELELSADVEADLPSR